MLNLLKLLVVNSDCSDWLTCENTSDSLESIFKRLISEGDDGQLSLNVCGCNIMDVLKLTPQPTPPTDAEEGWLYAGTDHHLYYHNGTGWQQIV